MMAAFGLTQQGFLKKVGEDFLFHFIFLQDEFSGYKHKQPPQKTVQTNDDVQVVIIKELLRS